MKKIHIAISVNNIAATVDDYTLRLGVEPVIVIDDEYALWRTDNLNLSIRYDKNCKSGALRHLGFEDPAANQFSTSIDVNDILWEHFNAHQQQEEINHTWPQANYQATDSI